MTLPPYEKLGSFYIGRKVDPQSLQDTEDLVLYDSRDLTTHAVCVGMTGSGKTGLCLSLLEEAAIDGIPVLAIDPKGDLGNLALQFPALRGADFLPWIDAGEASRKNQSPEQYAEAMAANWKQGLANSGQDGDRIRRLQAAAEVALYTPGSRAARPLSVLRSFTAPAREIIDDAEAFKDRIGGAAAGLLALQGIDADPLKSREHILLCNLFDEAWRAGRDVDLPTLIQSIQKPPFEKIGVFDVDSFFPAKDRLAFAMSLNNLLAAPGFSAWMEGEALDVQRLLYDPAGKPRVAIVSIAHLNDAERMFVVTLLLNEVVAWMRRQSGTSSLRAVLYMDEIFGYFPPSAMPPSKLPLLTLMKQARAFGLGVVLSTQNPVDLDYKGLSNAGTWFIGRLQTERDKARVIEGLLAADKAADKSELETLISQLGNRVFLMRNVHEDEPVLLRTRWALSYLRGPMTLPELRKLGSAAPAQTASFAPSAAAAQAASKPSPPLGIKEFHIAANQAVSAYVPRVLGKAKLHFVDSSQGVDVWQERACLAPLENDAAPDWNAAAPVDSKKLLTAGSNGAVYAELPAALMRPQNYATWSKDLIGFSYQSMTLELFRSASLDISSKPGETEGEFRARLGVALREKRDQETDRLRKKYAPRIATLQDQQRRGAQRVEREQGQLSQQKMQTAFSVGATILGALLGRKAISATTLGRAGTAARGAGRISSESADVDRASESLTVINQRLADLQAELEREIQTLELQSDSGTIVLETVAVKPRKSDILCDTALAWMPAG